MYESPFRVFSQSKIDYIAKTMRKKRKQCENILSDFLNRFSQISGRRPPNIWPQATPSIGRRPQRIAEVFACGKTGLSHRNHRNHRNPRKDDCLTP